MPGMCEAVIGEQASALRTGQVDRLVGEEKPQAVVQPEAEKDSSQSARKIQRNNMQAEINVRKFNVHKNLF